MAERVTIEAADMFVPQIRRIAKDAVEAATREDFGKLQKPVEEALVVRHSPGSGSGLALRMALASPVEAEVSVGDEPGTILRRLGQVELGNGDSSDLL